MYSSRRHLVEQRLEYMMIAAVDQQNVYRRTAQCCDDTEPREATADHDDSRWHEPGLVAGTLRCFS
jgi:hypothetical protein